MEALILAAALLTADAEVRQSCEFACWCQVSGFQDVEPLERFAGEHLDWLLNERDRLSWLRDERLISEAIHERYRALIMDTIAEQMEVLDSYRLVRAVRTRPYVPDDWDRLRRLRQLIGDDDYAAGRLPAPVTCQRH